MDDSEVLPPSPGPRSRRALLEAGLATGILLLLAALVALSLAQMGGDARVNACRSESQTLQAALDSYMYANNLIEVTPNPTPVSSWASAPPPGAGAPLYPRYLHQASTLGAYGWAGSGQITPFPGPPGNC